MCWHFDKKAQEQIFEDNPVWFEISGMGVMGRFTRPLPLPAPLELPAPYPILPLPDWGLVVRYAQMMLKICVHWHFDSNSTVKFGNLDSPQKIRVGLLCSVGVWEQKMPDKDVAD